MQHSSDIRRQRYGFCHLLFQSCKITVHTDSCSAGWCFCSYTCTSFMVYFVYVSVKDCAFYVLYSHI